MTQEDAARHAAALHRLADMLASQSHADETLAYLLLLAKALVREERSQLKR